MEDILTELTKDISSLNKERNEIEAERARLIQEKINASAALTEALQATATSERDLRTQSTAADAAQRRREAIERDLNSAIQERTKAEGEAVRIEERLKIEQETATKVMSSFEKEKESWRSTEDARAKAEKDLMQIQMARIVGTIIGEIV